MSNDDIKAKNRDLLKKNGKIKFLSFLCIEKIYFLYRHITLLVATKTRGNDVSVEMNIFTGYADRFFQLLSITLSKYVKALEPHKVESTTIDELHQIISGINKFQKQFSILPKYEAPIEIYRFLRIFNKGEIVTDKRFVLYPNDTADLAIYLNSPLSEFEKKTMVELSSNIGKHDGSAGGDKAYHVSIPRETIDSPLYWPLLAHEFGHLAIKEKDYFGGSDIHEKYKEISDTLAIKTFTPEFEELYEKIPSASKLEKEKVLSNWLEECWCDLYGYFATGAAFIFAQRNQFLSLDRSHMNYNSSHPPHYLRLLLLTAIAQEHQDDLFRDIPSSDAMLAEVTNCLLPDEKKEQDVIYNLAANFCQFFKKVFALDPPPESPAPLADIGKLKELLKGFTVTYLNKLVNRVGDGLPIPTIRLDDNTLSERQTSVYEIMTAGWLAHDDNLATDVLEMISGHIIDCKAKTPEENRPAFIGYIAPLFERFNQSILRSLQVSEWASILVMKYAAGTDRPAAKNLIETITSGLSPEAKAVEEAILREQMQSVLVDSQIRELLKHDILKIYPLIEGDSQIGSTSVDVRLGTTFQTYQPNQSGVVDFCDQQSVQIVQRNSTVRDLDLGDSLVVAPGQFVLSHTMEYIGLPDWLAAQLEGRSSFARLGVQVHMTANLIDPGFHGSITFEIFNAGPNPIRLYPGFRLGQLRFFPCRLPEKPYNRKATAKYKGLLGHSDSLLMNDYEIKCLNKFLNEKSNRKMAEESEPTHG